MDMKSYTMKGYTIVEGPGACMIHKGDETGPVVNMVNDLAAAYLWINNEVSIAEEIAKKDRLAAHTASFHNQRRNA